MGRSWSGVRLGRFPWECTELGERELELTWKCCLRLEVWVSAPVFELAIKLAMLSWDLPLKRGHGTKYERLAAS